MESFPNISKEDVIAKLKDDGDFDKLRHKIVRKLKENETRGRSAMKRLFNWPFWNVLPRYVEELRNNIISMVKQSTALNHPGIENMKPRQLSDAIHEEVGNKVMSQISDGVWEIIRTGDGMKSEIAETVQSVYNKLLYPKGKEEGESSTHDATPVQKEGENNGSITASACEVDDTAFDSEPKAPPGFSLPDNSQNSNHEEQQKEELQLPMPHEGPTEEHKENSRDPKDVLEPLDVDFDVPPGFSTTMEHKQTCDGSDEDPDVPPGFG